MVTVLKLALDSIRHTSNLHIYIFYLQLWSLDMVLILLPMIIDPRDMKNLLFHVGNRS